MVMTLSMLRPLPRSHDLDALMLLVQLCEKMHDDVHLLVTIIHISSQN
uniref:Uncharacterized protein n=1 Tax=Onchocerca volvulus TaxID=6282 RepID=A0A8R1XLH6_ONCVO